MITVALTIVAALLGWQFSAILYEADLRDARNELASMDAMAEENRKLRIELANKTELLRHLENIG